MDLGIEQLEQYKNQINIGLHKTQSYICDLKVGNSDLAFIVELFLEELLTEIYSYKRWYFTNINFERVNAPAIDLVDKKNRICFQVTITSASGKINEKIKDTLTSFYKRKLDKEYGELYILFASGIPESEKIKKIPIEIDGKPVEIKKELFNNKHVLKLTDLFKEIFDDHKRKDLKKIINVLFKILNRPEKKIIPFNFERTYIERTVLDYKNKQNIYLIDEIEKNRLNILLGVGGMGKTTETNFISNKVRVCLKMI